ncbi:hypothetical protein L798_03854 [Zootermopsis nevadensis]|uniref:Uncharacterized protein n=1 Tax=Zootermopsis nevadensis TaxID=136037 RepID=A0A067RF39_ZOONE|nr:hypothetical protein L798_03854 [Zootermopsis nevadensis]
MFMNCCGHSWESPGLQNAHVIQTYKRVKPLLCSFYKVHD